MTRTHPDGLTAHLLTEQLRAALADSADNPDIVIEAACLAGLRARLHADDALQAEARALGAGIPAEALSLAAQRAADAVVEIDTSDEPEVAWDRLCALDELCSAAFWLSRLDGVEDAVDLVVRVVVAFPEPWVVHAGAAAEVLSQQPPLLGDPAGRLWRTIEGAGLAVEGGAGGPGWDELDDPAADAAIVALGLQRRSYSFAAIGRAGFAQMAAASGVPAAPTWASLQAGPGWEVALTVDDAGRPIVLVASDARAQPTATRDEQAVLAELTPGGWAFPAKHGKWRVVVGEPGGAAELEFEIDP